MRNRPPPTEVSRSNPTPVQVGSRTGTEAFSPLNDGALGGVSPSNRAVAVAAVRAATHVPRSTMIDPTKPMDTAPDTSRPVHPSDLVDSRPALPMPEPGSRRTPGGSPLPVAAPVALPAPEVRQPAATPTAAVVSVPVQGPPAMTRPKRTAVTLSSDTMGRLRVKVDFLSVSASVIALGYIDDDDTTVIEPPRCDIDHPLTVDVGADRYSCLSGDWSFESEIGGLKVLWVVLVRLSG